MRSRPRIVFLARQLSVGGAERQLAVLASGLARQGWDVVVLTFYPAGGLEEDLAGSGVRVRNLEKRGRWDVLGFFQSVRRALADERPDLIHSYLDGPNLVAAIARVLFRSAPVVWGVRASGMDWRGYDRSRRLAFEATRLFASVPVLIIANSEAGRGAHGKAGYPLDRMRVIPNGIDTERFAPDRPAGRKLRLELGIEAHAPLIGIVGRLDPMKGHSIFLQAAARIAKSFPDARFLVVGSGDRAYADAIRREALELGIADQIIWREAQRDVAALYNALDVLVVASTWGEGFPNVLAEAMACGVRCVSTDSGDAGLIMADLAKTVATGDPEGLATECIRMLSLDDDAAAAWARDARNSIIERFSVARLIDRSAAALHGVIA